MKTIVIALGALLVAGLVSAQPAQARCFWDGILGWQCTPDPHPLPSQPVCLPYWPYCQ